MLVLSMVVNHT